MSDFFQPPATVPSGRAASDAAPPWTGRPQGPTPGEVLSELVLARSERATLLIAYLDAYPEGFELRIRADTTVPYHDFTREGDHGPDPFGCHWPLAGEPTDRLPEQLLRVGVQFSDGRTATNIAGHDHPPAGPVMWPLRGGGRGSGGESHFEQGYWVSPLPPLGPMAVLCQWPAVGIPVVRHELEAQMLLDGADRARALFPADQHAVRHGERWRLGGEAQIAWINQGTAAGREITAAIPPSFPAYCTVRLPQAGEDQPAVHERALIERLTAHTQAQPWWLGYLDTGASDVVFPYAPRSKVYCGYGYVLVEAGPAQASSWRRTGFNTALPDLMFPADRSWLASTMWDDEWTSIGGSEPLVSSLLADPVLGPMATRVAPGEVAAPAPGPCADLTETLE